MKMNINVIRRLSSKPLYANYRKSYLRIDFTYVSRPEPWPNGQDVISKLPLGKCSVNDGYSKTSQVYGNIGFVDSALCLGVFPDNPDCRCPQFSHNYTLVLRYWMISKLGQLTFTEYTVLGDLKMSPLKYCVPEILLFEKRFEFRKPEQRKICQFKTDE